MRHRWGLLKIIRFSVPINITLFFNLGHTSIEFAHPSTMNSSSASLRSLPADVIRHHIFRPLGPASLAACSLTSSWLRKIILTRIPSNKAKNTTLPMIDIYRGGFIELLQWAQKTLKYPKLNELESPARYELFSLACEGEVVWFIINLRPNFSFFLVFFTLLFSFSGNCISEAQLYLYSYFFRPGAHVPLLQHAVDEGHFLGANICEHAARGGHLLTLEWLRARGYEFNARVCATAAVDGHLEVKGLHQLSFSIHTALMGNVVLILYFTSQSPAFKRITSLPRYKFRQ